MGDEVPRAAKDGELQEALQRQAEDLGIQRLGRGEEEPTSFLGERLGQPGTREQAEAHIRRLSALRRGIEAAKAKPVTIEGRTAPVLSGAPAGGALSPDSPEPGVWTGLYGAAEPGARVIDDEKSWKAAWESLGVREAPAVDFSKLRAAAVFLGPRPTGGYRVEVLAPVETKGALVVRYRETGPVPGRAPPEGGSAPYAMRLIPKTSLPVRFERAP